MGIENSELFDEKIYLTANPDVAAAVERGEFASAIKHFQECGFREGRMFNAHQFNEEIYLAVNPDVAIAVGRGTIASAVKHFQEFGLREGRIATVHQFVREQARQIASLKLELSQRKAEIAAIHLTKSWRLTQPFREVTLLPSRFRELMRLDRKNLEGTLHEVLMLKDDATNNNLSSLDVAVHAHIYYPDMASEILEYLSNIPIDFCLYLTTDTPEKAESIRLTFLTLKKVKKLNIIISENRGRDILPMLVKLGPKLAKHELVLHIHSKRSPHNVASLSGWRRYLMESLLGSPQRVTSIIQQFLNDKTLGILFPCHYHPVKRMVDSPTGSNDENMKKLLQRAGKEPDVINSISKTVFPSGNMFWFRGKAIKKLVKLKLSVEDFEPEMGQFDQTMAHAIERLFPYFAGEMGMSTKSYLAETFLSPECSAHKLDLFLALQAKNLIIHPTILFDHNGGGGTNIYTDELVKIINSDGNAVLRIYPFEGGWIVQWLGKGDGMLFHTSSSEELYHALSMSQGTNIVINSLYGQPDVKICIDNIIELAQKLSATLEVRIHDFNALCPSQHLVDFQGKYCHVPEDLRVCENCLKRSPNLYHPWYPEQNKTNNIAVWRKPFAKLFEAATKVVFFDPSSVEIVRRAFKLDSIKVEINPHSSNYFTCDHQLNLGGPLHIGLLGTMTNTKGADIVKELYEHIAGKGLHIPITLVGPTIVPLPANINVHGNYTPNDLPIIIDKQAINVILIPSIVPETFSYTISEAMKMKLPIVAFDIGAQGNRVKQYKLGEVVPMGSSPEVILTAIKSVLATAQELNS